MVDVRSALELRQGPLPAASNNPWGNVRKNALSLPLNFTCLVCWDAGETSHCAGGRLLRRRAQQIISLHAGRFEIQNWPARFERQPNLFSGTQSVKNAEGPNPLLPSRRNFAHAPI